MTSFSSLRAIAGLLFGGLFFAGESSRSQSVWLGELAGRAVSMQLVREDDLSPVQGTCEKPNLSAVPVQISKESALYGMLHTNGVIPDTEAFGLVYDLNPTLGDLKHLKAATVILLPKIGCSRALTDKLGSTYLVALTVDPETRRRLNQGIDRLQTTAAQFYQMPADRFESPGKSEAIKTMVEVLAAKWFLEIKKSFLRRTDPPLRVQTLAQLSEEVDVLNSLLPSVPT